MARDEPVRQGNRMQESCRKRVTLVLGGVRSGKSRYAQLLGEGVHARGGRVLFVATATVEDEEMRVKIERHQATRPAAWATVEEQLEVGQVLLEAGAECALAVVDCLTLYAAHVLGAGAEDEAATKAHLDRLCAGIAAAKCDVVLVSNEVGSGVVPEYESGRRFRDVLGELNQRVAALADDVVLLVAGLPLALKGEVRA